MTTPETLRPEYLHAIAEMDWSAPVRRRSHRALTREQLHACANLWSASELRLAEAESKWRHLRRWASGLNVLNAQQWQEAVIRMCDDALAPEPSTLDEYMAKYPGGLKEWEDLHGRQEP